MTLPEPVAWLYTEEVGHLPYLGELSVLLISLAIFGPAATTWFGFLQRNVVLKNSKATIVARVAADQCLFTPTHLTCFLTSMAIMEGSDPIEKWRNSFLPSYKANLTIWPLVQGVNFSIVPLEYRVLVVNLVSLGMCHLFSVKVLYSTDIATFRLELPSQHDQ
ncbi:unnamed protein product [Aspergillus oryzae]|uniref:Unnamed protein product n=1 Tax=Aspergillus oryzae var. brunneus TaxID=332754 RepID=A0ABQ6KJR4_ASPOZ|nr:unnamed protein product [Aspergillus oryzae]GMF94429.1 unnamed protein product [Aspergillus oryzae]GMG03764.1 unnamed protein product [Aspergillus oryzae]GMG45468.1 unnamed protein product [Aspergillus oryzae var. brunneus]